VSKAQEQIPRNSPLSASYQSASRVAGFTAALTPSVDGKPVPEYFWEACANLSIIAQRIADELWTIWINSATTLGPSIPMAVAALECREGPLLAFRLWRFSRQRKLPNRWACPGDSFDHGWNGEFVGDVIARGLNGARRTVITLARRVATQRLAAPRDALARLDLAWPLILDLPYDAEHGFGRPSSSFDWAASC